MRNATSIRRRPVRLSVSRSVRPVRRTGSVESARFLVRHGAFVGFIGLLAAIVASYWTTLATLAEFWYRNEDYSVGALVPGVAAYLVWRRRTQLDQSAAGPCRWGLVILGASQLIRLAALYYGSEYSERLSMIIAIVGSVVLVSGVRIATAMGWVMVFLLLMVPLPMRLHDVVSPTLQGWSTTIGQFGLEIAGFYVTREGNILRIDDGSAVLVAEACSGLRMLTAFIFVGAVLAFLVERPRWQRYALLLATLPIAVISNGIRIFATALFFHYTEGEEFERVFHDIAGLAMMPLALILLFGFLYAIPVLNTGDGTVVPPKRPMKGNRVLRGTGCRLARLATCGAGLLLSVGAVHWVAEERIIAALGRVAQLRNPLSSLPLEIGDWYGKEVPLTTDVTRAPNFDDDFANRTYCSQTSGRTLSAFIGYVGRPRVRIGHRPDVCYAAHGWRQISEERLEVIGADGRSVPCVLYTFDRPNALDRPMLVLSTYISNGRYITSSVDLARWNSRAPAMFGERPAYLARVQVSMKQSASPEADIAALRDFVAEIVDPIIELMPYWNEPGSFRQQSGRGM